MAAFTLTTCASKEFAQAFAVSCPSNGHRFRRAAMLLSVTTIFGGALAGCATVGPDYRKPDMPLKPFHSAAAVSGLNKSLTSTSAPLDTWWQGFNDPELTTIIQRAQSQNLDLAGSLARVEQADALARQAHARRMPSGSLDVQTDTMHQSLLSPIGEL